MRKIYDFERETPPLLTEAILAEKLARRRQRRETMMIAVSALLLQLLALLFGARFGARYPLLALFCLAYVFVSVLGGASVAVLFARKGEDAR